MASVISKKSPKLSRELQAICRRLGISRYVPVAIRLLGECFPKRGEFRAYPAHDPESGEEWLVLDVQVPGTFEEVDRQYHEYTRRKVELLPPKHAGAVRLHHRRV